MLKRCFDAMLSAIGLLLLAPAMVLIGLLVRVGDGDPIFYRQKRIGRNGKSFFIYKFRTMRVESDREGPYITKAGDERVTRIGQLLRRFKLDELPQLLNVFTGDMSFVGPRPEVPCYVALYTDEQRRVLALRPGITDLATLEFRNEEELLARAEDPERFYREYCLPRKIELNLAYADKASLLSDIGMIMRTLFEVARPRDRPKLRLPNS